MPTRKQNTTKEKIIDAFIDIYSLTPLHQMTIKEITDRAGCHRGTFYLYFTDIYDLLSFIENRLLSGLPSSKMRTLVIDANGEALREVMASELLDYISANSRYFLALLASTSDHHFAHLFKQLIKENLTVALDHPHIDYIAEFVAAADLNLLTFWLENDQSLTSAQLADLMYQIMFKGILSLTP